MIPTINEVILNEAKTSVIYAFDIDDTLLFSDAKIYYTEPGKPEKAVGTLEFGEIRSTLDPKTTYDWRDFEVFDRIVVGMKSAKPNMEILKILDKAIQDGYKIGIVTARGNQKAIWAALQASLLYRDKKGILQPLPSSQFNMRYVFAVGDALTKKSLGIEGGSANPSALKAHVLQKIFGDRFGFKSIVFFDDDAGNIKAVDDLKDPRIKTVKV